MALLNAFNPSRVMVRVAAVLASLLGVLAAQHAAAATIVVTPGEQNTASGENGCAMTPCAGGHWLHYPELLQVALGAAYTVQNNGDGGAVLGCDAGSATIAGGDSFCKSGKYTASIAMPPGIAIIGPFGEHDQRIIVKSAANKTALYNAAAFEAAYEGIVLDYLKLNAKVLMMTPIDVPFNSGALGAGEDIVKDLMLPASKKVALAHNLTVVDTYTAISGTPALVTQYYGNDGQVNSAGQQKMAELILAALNSSSVGGAGGTGGTGGVAGSGGTAGASGGTGGVSGGGSGPVAAGAAGAATGGGGTGGAPSGAGGAIAVAGAATTGSAGEPVNNSEHDSSCAVSVSGNSRGNSPASGLLLMLGMLAFARRRAARR